MLAGQQWFDPHTLAAALDEIAMSEVFPRHIEMVPSNVAHDYADIADRDFRQRHRIHPDEPRVEVPRAGQQHFLLQAAASARGHEVLATLKAVVTGHNR